MFRYIILYFSMFMFLFVSSLKVRLKIVERSAFSGLQTATEQQRRGVNRCHGFLAVREFHPR